MLRHIDDDDQIEGFYFTDSDGDDVKIRKLGSNNFQIAWEGYDSGSRDIEMDKVTLTKLIRALNMVKEL